MSIDAMSFYETSNSMPTGTKRKRRSNMPHACKLALIEAVKARTPIWDKSDARHSDTNAVNACWRQIAEELEKSVEECKTTWSSIRDSRRYYLSIKGKKKSGDAGGDPIGVPVVDDYGEWEFSKELSFLPEIATKRTTFKSSIALGFQATPENDSSCSTPNYNYAQCSTPNFSDVENPAKPDGVDRIVESFEAFVKERRQQSRKHASSLLYMDELLNKLSDEKADELKFEFILKLQTEVANLKK